MNGLCRPVPCGTRYRGFVVSRRSYILDVKPSTPPVRIYVVGRRVCCLLLRFCSRMNCSTWDQETNRKQCDKKSNNTTLEFSSHKGFLSVSSFFSGDWKKSFIGSAECDRSLQALFLIPLARSLQNIFDLLKKWFLKAASKAIDSINENKT